MKIVTFSIIAISALALAGCASTWSTSSVDSSSADAVATSAPRKSPAKIMLTHGDIKNRGYKLIGDITVTVNKTTAFDANPTQEMVAAKLKEKAAEMGADAVIFVRYGKVGMGILSWGSLEGKGRAVKFNK